MSSNDLFGLLSEPNGGEIKRLDDDAIIKELKQNPESAALKHDFSKDNDLGPCSCYPLHQAVRLKASINVVEAIHNCYPPAVKTKYEGGSEDGSTVLNLAFSYKAPTDVALFVFHKWPEATREKDSIFCFLPLHNACFGGFPVDVVSLLLNSWPESIYEKECTGSIPLFCALSGMAPTEVVSLLINAWPDSVREKDWRGRTPLHCRFDTDSLDLLREKVCLFLDQNPDALREKDHVDGWTPLHAACSRNDTPIEVILMLLEAYPEAAREKSYIGETPIDLCDEDNQPGDVWKVLSYVFHLLERKMDSVNLKEILNFFIDIEWWKGVGLILDRYPSFYKCLKIDTKVFPQFIYAVGHHCMMKTVWHIMSNEPDIMEGICV